MKDEQLVNWRSLKVYRRSFRHGPDVGTSRHIEISVGPVRFFVERAVGLYGFRHTVSYSIRWWFER